MDSLSAASASAYSGLSAQSQRMRTIAENLANAESTGNTPGADPYRRKLVSFKSTLDEVSGAELTRIGSVEYDMSAFPIEYSPGPPAADSKGYVKLPNVSMLVEMADMREASRSYEANLQTIRQAREMSAGLVDLLRST